MENLILLTLYITGIFFVFGVAALIGEFFGWE